ncbi:MAG: hypothetical protein JSU63_17220 [Phycisphaerales bacterium]|nr:MAG: hypothetical protein JSU63_17220 [Phycisphaerales bacterium]
MNRPHWMIWSLPFVVALVQGSCAKADDLTDPIEILKRADAAARRVKTVQYDVVVETTGAFRTQIERAEGTFLGTGYVDGFPEKYRVDFTLTMPGSPIPIKLSLGTDNEKFFLVDHQSKTAHEDMYVGVQGPTGRGVMQGLLGEFHHPTPFDDEINGRSHELIGSEEIHGEDCYKVHVIYIREDSPDVIWYFSKKDYLPRRRVDLHTRGEMANSRLIRTVKNLVVNPKLAPDCFKLKVPPGYAKTDEPAPGLFEEE